MPESLYLTRGKGAKQVTSPETPGQVGALAEASHQDRFATLVEEIRSRSEAIMAAKAQEYGSDKERLRNFREIGALANLRVSRVALTFLLKHIQSIALAVNSGDFDNWDWQLPTGGEGLKQRIADAINYLYLLAMCIEEEASAGKDAGRPAGR